MFAAAMRQDRLFFVTKSSRNDPENVSAAPHKIFLSSQPETQNAAAFVRRRAQRGIGGAAEDQVCVSCLRRAGRFVSSRWHCVQLPSSFSSLPLQRGPTMAQGGMPGPITPAITPSGITPIVICDTPPASRTGTAALPECRRAGLRTATPASYPIPSMRLRQARLDPPIPSPVHARDIGKPSGRGSSAAPSAPRTGSRCREDAGRRFRRHQRQLLAERGHRPKFNPDAARRRDGAGHHLHLFERRR